jgi:hypothetical protein
MSNLIIVFSGKKGSGKNTACKYAIGKYLEKFGFSEPMFNEKGCLTIYRGCRDDVANLISINDDGSFGIYANEEESILDFGIKLFSFADPWKDFCTDVLGIDHHKVWGTQKQKEELTNITWDGLPEKVLIAWSEEERGKKPDSGILEFFNTYKEEYNIPAGQMSGREVLQVFGTDIIRRWYNDAWANATYIAINKWFKESKHNKLALVCDGRFPNEMDGGLKNNAKIIRLLRDPYNGTDQHASETALDDYPMDKYSIVIDNRNMSIKEQCEFMKPYLEKWFGDM